MKTYLDCIPCFFTQALRAGRIATNDEMLIKRMLDDIGLRLKDISLDCTPPEIGRTIYGRIREMTGQPDPYRAIKDRSTAKGLELYPELKKVIAQSEDPLLTAVRLAVAGNIIDFGVFESVDIDDTIQTVMKQKFAIGDYPLFRERIEAAQQILYIGDNAGETVFDRMLIEEIGKPVVYAVRAEPVINDATHDDAVAAGIDGVATIVSSGTDAPGAVLPTCSDEFIERLEQAELIISKGQGNYEGLSQTPYPIFFLLMAKCRIIASDIGVTQGDIILKAHNL